MASTPRSLPSPEEIVAREAGQRRTATFGAIIGAALTAVAVILDQMVASAGVPSAKSAADMVETFSAKIAGTDYPSSFWTAYAKFKIDHGTESVLSSGLRGIALVMVVPIVLLVLRGARERGGSLAKFLEPLVVAGLVGAAVATAITGAVELSTFKSTGPEFLPKSVLDALTDSDLVAVNGAREILSLLIALPVAMMSIQAMRTGMLPRVLGFMGVLVGLLFVLPYDQTGLLRAFWFAAIAFVAAGRLPGGLPEAWAKGVGVAPTPRQPPTPREPKAKKGPKLTK